MFKQNIPLLKSWTKLVALIIRQVLEQMWIIETGLQILKGLTWNNSEVKLRIGQSNSVNKALPLMASSVSSFWTTHILPNDSWAWTIASRTPYWTCCKERQMYLWAVMVFLTHLWFANLNEITNADKIHIFSHNSSIRVNRCI